jgi:hypothetical protein
MILTVSVTSVPVKVEDPDTKDVTVNVLCPELLVVALTVVIESDVPRDELMEVVFPETGFPYVSFKLTVTVVEELPSATTLVGEALIVLCDAETDPAETATGAHADAVKLPLVACTYSCPAKLNPISV